MMFRLSPYLGDRGERPSLQYVFCCAFQISIARSNIESCNIKRT